MVRSFLVTVLLLLLAGSGHAQSNIILTFRADFEGFPQAFDSIHIRNMTAGTDTVLYGNDTTLFLDDGIGMGELPSGANGGMVLFPNYPNPFDGSTTVSFWIPGDEVVQLKVFNLQGIEVARWRQSLQRGYHNFTFMPGNDSYYLLSVESSRQRLVQKMVHLGSEKHTCQLRYNGMQETGTHFRVGTVSFDWTPGDVLLMTGYATPLSGIAASDVIIDNPSVSTIYTFQMKRGLPCPEEPFVSDIDGNVYPTVKIGQQCWLRKNLTTSRFATGSQIPLITSPAGWAGLTAPARSWYNDDSATYSGTYGSLYNWYSVNAGSLCPAGWHIPDDLEWSALEAYLGGDSMAAAKLKESGSAHWSGLNLTSTNASGFTALPGGMRSPDQGLFYDLLHAGSWWTTSLLSPDNAWMRRMDTVPYKVHREFADLNTGNSVRCLRNDTITYTLPPKALFTLSDTMVFEQDTVTFTDLSTGQPLTWKWYFGDGDSSLQQHPEHIYSTNGIYSVSLIVSNPYGSDTLVRIDQVTVSAPPVYYPVYDYDGNGYDTVIIGTQVWLKQNLRTSHYKDGVTIPNVTSNFAWTSQSTGARCWYNNDSVLYDSLYGSLYNWYAVSSGKLCPAGWTVPTEADWTALSNTLGGLTTSGGPMKDTVTSTWNYPNTGATNSSGFSGRAGGLRDFYNNGLFSGQGDTGKWWSLSESESAGIWNRSLSYASDQQSRSEESKFSGFSVRCIADSVSIPLTLPYIQLLPINFNSVTSVTTGGYVILDGGTAVTARGVCWNTQPNPTVANNLTVNGTGLGTFPISIAGLSPANTYYIRAYAINQVGTTYSTEQVFSTLSAGTYPVYDYDGNGYDTVHIGNQIWMKQNLRTRRLNNGTNISNYTSGLQWGSTTLPAMVWYNNDSATHFSTYGGLYNQYAAENQTICPSGYHVPSTNEWNTLTDQLLGTIHAGGHLKATGTTWWSSPNLNATNSSGFTALPGGKRDGSGSSYSFSMKGSTGYFWSSTSNSSGFLNYRLLYHNAANISNLDNVNKNIGFSIRCLCDTAATPWSTPTVNTNSVTSLTYNTANVACNVLSDGGSPVTSRGICWSYSTKPTLADHFSLSGSGTGSYTPGMSGLYSSSTYYVRSFAVNAAGITYGNQLTVNTPAPPSYPVYDIDGNGYDTIRIGNQYWLKQNLTTSRYTDGDSIATAATAANWSGLISGGTGWLSPPAHPALYGKHYNWYAVTTDKLCPVGWRVPTSAEFDTLTQSLGGGSSAGDKMKLGGTQYWPNNTTTATNSSNFSVYPGGMRTTWGNFYYPTNQAYFWSSSELSSTNASGRQLYDTSAAIFTVNADKKSGYSVRCIGDFDTLNPDMPVINLDSTVSLTTTTATFTVNILHQGNSPVSIRGVCWSTTPLPTIYNQTVTSGSGGGSFNVTINGLISGYYYYARGYAINAKGIVYTRQVRFRTRFGDAWPVYDIDNNGYDTVKIGTQLWLKQNLKTTRYNDGSPIPLEETGLAWSGLTTGARCWYNNDSVSYADHFGALYNHYAVTSSNICPAGWHAPNDTAWLTMRWNFGTLSDFGGKLKDAGPGFWTPPNTGATNELGFTGLPGGCRQSTGTFADIDNIGYFWTTSLYSSNGRSRNIKYNTAGISEPSANRKSGFSLRCVWDFLFALPELYTLPVDSIGTTFATTGGKITSDGNDSILTRGVCWSTSNSPTIADDTIVINSNDDHFYSVITGLKHVTQYYIRAWAINSSGIAYGNILTFNTLDKSYPVYDANGNGYDTVHIGSQIWFKSNLRATSYNDSIPIPKRVTYSQRKNLTAGEYSVHHSWGPTSASLRINGLYYTWYAVATGKLCPQGWHVSTDADWHTLTNYVGGANQAGGMLKDNLLNNWIAPNTGATNSSGFTALPSGYYKRVIQTFTAYEASNTGTDAIWWTTAESSPDKALYWSISNQNILVNRNVIDKDYGFSVRCVCDSSSPPWQFPQVTTDTVTGITTIQASVQATVHQAGTGPVLEKGICYGLGPSPTTASDKVVAGSGTGSFSAQMTGLTPGHRYYVRAFATNHSGTGYGKEFIVNALPSPTYPVYDIDGNGYDTVHIGPQVWLRQNLRVRRFTNSLAIPLVTDTSSWLSLTTAARVWYENDSATYAATFGSLYNWFAASSGNICPSGYRVPSRADWNQLINTLGGGEIAGGRIKQPGYGGWMYPNVGTGVYHSGFKGTAGGYREAGNGGFADNANNATWWTSNDTTTSWSYMLKTMYTLGSASITYIDKTRGQAIRCVRNLLLVGPFLPATSVISISAVTSQTAIAACSLSYEGGATVTARGLCFGTAPAPTLLDSVVSSGTGTGAFNINLTNLLPGTTYYVRAYATNSVGTSYSNEMSFITLVDPSPVVLDIDGNGYDTVHIGNQIWLQQNLITTRYNDGTTIPLVTDTVIWSWLTTGARCLYNNTSTNLGIYGMLYSGHALQSGNLCPVGWHVPSDGEWAVLESYLGGPVVAGGVMKEAASIYWNAPNTGASNSVAFTARPGGMRNPTGSFKGINTEGNWWSTTGPDSIRNFTRRLYSNNSYIDPQIADKRSGASVRCIIDSLTLPWALPLVTTDSVLQVTDSNAFVGGEVITGNGGAVTSRGICWSTSPNPTTNDSVLSFGSGTGTFSDTLSGLQSGTHYYIRAFAVNAAGTAYGNENQILTLYTPFPVYDIDSNFYNGFRIGTQYWLDRNLATSRLNDGTAIPVVTDGTVWKTLTTPGRCWYDNDSASYHADYGTLYNWNAVNTGKLCPAGWHVPTYNELLLFRDYLGGITNSGGKLKETGLLHWLSPNEGATDQYLFSARGGGYRKHNTSGGSFYSALKSAVFFWSSTEIDANYAWSSYITNISSSYFVSSAYGKPIGSSIRCIADSSSLIPDSLANVTTGQVTNRTQTTATISGTVNTDGGATVMARGICWSNNPNPTIQQNSAFSGSGTGSYGAAITGLLPESVYHARAFAINAVGVAYGSTIIFSTLPEKFFPPRDKDNNIYDTVQIGNQLWLNENLRTTRYMNGVYIPFVTGPNAWNNLTTPGRSYYQDDSINNGNIYGALYNWQAVNSGNLCPEGFYVATDGDWTTLTTYLGGTGVAGAALKDTGSAWTSPNTGSTNTTGFSALPGGYISNYNTWTGIGTTGAWWTSTPVYLGPPVCYIAYYRMMQTNYNQVFSGEWDKMRGLSARCIADFNIVPYLKPDNMTTDSATAITPATALLGGSVLGSGSTPVIARGVCYSKNPYPTIFSDTTLDGSGLGSFTSVLTGLSGYTTYYVRSYALNDAGVSYGNMLTFRTLPLYYPVYDVDNNHYDTVHIGTQVWLKQNLRATRNYDGMAIPTITQGTAWSNLTTEAKCWYNHDSASFHAQTGLLYNWHSANMLKICPHGYRVPNDSDWTVLTDYLGGLTLAGAALKDTGFVYWNNPNTSATNASGFTALAGGYRNNNYGFYQYGNTGRWWTSTGQSTDNAWYREISHNNTVVVRNTSDKNNGYSIRCLME